MGNRKRTFLMHILHQEGSFCTACIIWDSSNFHEDIKGNNHTSFIYSPFFKNQVDYMLCKSHLPINKHEDVSACHNHKATPNNLNQILRKNS